MIVTSFYKYVEIKNPELFQKEHQEYYDKLEIKGKVLVAKEGINGSVSGNETQISEYKKDLLDNELFAGMAFKDNEIKTHPFKKTMSC